MDNKTIINTFNSDNRNIANIKKQYHQIMTTITERIVKFNSMIKRPVITNHTNFTVITLKT